MTVSRPTDFGAPRASSRDFRDPALARSLLRRARLDHWLYFNRIHLVRLREVRAIAARLGHFQVREVRAEDIADLERIHSRPGLYEPKFGAGDFCIVAYAREDPAAMAWFSPGPEYRSGENRYSLSIGAAGCWSYWVDVRPEYRLRGALVKLWTDGMSLLQGRGFHDVYTGIEEANRISLQSHLRLGFAPICILSYLRVAGVQRYRVAYPEGRAVSGFGRWHGHMDPPAPD